MPKFQVTMICTKVFTKDFEIEAEDESEAEDAAFEMALEEDRTQWDEPGIDSLGYETICLDDNDDEAEEEE